MATDPTVCAIMPTADRPQFARRAVECFRQQTYPHKRLFVLDTSVGGGFGVHSFKFPLFENGEYFHDKRKRDRSIGELRNFANTEAILYQDGRCKKPDILIHWDDDDYSHPNRIAEQVALLHSSGKPCVGYRRVLFGDQRDGSAEAWEYSNPNPSYAVGSSLAYLMTAWEKAPFKATSQGEDADFIMRVGCFGVDGIGDDPRIACRIHAGNTSNAYGPALMSAVERQGGEWHRRSDLDTTVRRLLNG